MHPSKNRGRNLLLALLALLLLSGTILGALRITNPCLLGSCPAMKLSTSEVDFVNNDSQPVTISNSGTADLHWSASNQGSASWLSLVPSTGTLPPSKNSLLKGESYVSASFGSKLRRWTNPFSPAVARMYWCGRALSLLPPRPRHSTHSVCLRVSNSTCQCTVRF